MLTNHPSCEFAELAVEFGEDMCSPRGQRWGHLRDRHPVFYDLAAELIASVAHRRQGYDDIGLVEPAECLTLRRTTSAGVDHYTSGRPKPLPSTGRKDRLSASPFLSLQDRPRKPTHRADHRQVNIGRRCLRDTCAPALREMGAPHASYRFSTPKPPARSDVPDGHGPLLC
jgi:hypothetical protein